MSDRKNNGEELNDEQMEAAAGGISEGWEAVGETPPGDKPGDGRRIIKPKVPEIPFPGQE